MEYNFNEKELDTSLSEPLMRFGDGFMVTRFEEDRPSKVFDQVYELRQKVFADELGWVPADGVEGERDKYDAHSIHFVAFQKDSEKVAGYIRLIPPENSFMLEDEFRDLLLPSDFETLNLRKQESAEVSRLALQKDLRGGRIGLSLNMSLYRQMYHWCLENKTRYLYMVIAPSLLKFFQRFIPSCVPIGIPKRYQEEHDQAMVAVADLRDAEDRLGRDNPELLQWFLNKNQTESD